MAIIRKNEMEIMEIKTRCKKKIVPLMNSSVHGMAEKRISKLEDWFIKIEIKNKSE